MKDIVLTGIGGQGTVLAAKVLAQAAENRGWHVRTAETIGMAQRGGSVVSHVRMGDEGERVSSPLVPMHQADVLIGFEPGEAARMREVLSPTGKLITASTAIQPVTASLSRHVYTAQSVLEPLARVVSDLVIVDEKPLLEAVGNPKALNIVLLTVAVKKAPLGITVDELKQAIAVCVKPKFVDMNLAAVDYVSERF
jgi:indolepyruvate ferredoxin oxidoreductase beta subunit